MNEGEGRACLVDWQDDADAGDETLMAEVAAGNRQAFDRLARRHLASSLRLAQRVAGNAHDAEEIVQDSFVQVWVHAASWQGDRARFTTWLYRIVVNRALTYRRRRGFMPLDAAAAVPADAPAAHEVVEARQVADLVDAAVAGLPERQRAAISLCLNEDLTCAEAAEVLHVTVSAMESLLVRARRGLRARLQPVFGTGDGRNKS